MKSQSGGWRNGTFVCACGAAASMSLVTAVAAQDCEPHWNNEIGQPGVASSTQVRALQVFDDGLGGGPALYAGGSFTFAGGEPANRIAKWDGTSWSPLSTGMAGCQGVSCVSIVNALAVFDDGTGPALYAGGTFNTARGLAAARIAKWNGTSWSAVGGGLPPSPAYTGVHSLAVFDDGSGPALFAGGNFIGTVDGVTYFYCGKWNGTSWSAAGAFGGDSPTVRSFAVYDDGNGPALYAAGHFTSPAQGIVKWTGTTWENVGGSLNNGGGYALTVHDDGTGPALYLGGAFAQAGGVAATNLAKWDGTEWSAVGESLHGIDHHIAALHVYDDGTGTGPALFIGGNAGGTVSAPAMRKWDGDEWSTINIWHSPAAFTVYDDGSADGPSLVVGGNFSNAGGMPAGGIAKYVGCPYQWKNPTGGQFGVLANWANNRLPDENNLVLFGQVAGDEVFPVTFTDDFTSQSLRITKQRPRFEFDGHTYTALGSVNVGEDQIGVLRISDGTLVTPRLTVEPLGHLLGDATIASNITNKGIVQPGLPIGTLHVIGDFTQWPGGAFRAEIRPEGADVMEVSGTATLAGTIDIKLAGGVQPQLGQSFPVLVADEIVGGFAAGLFPFVADDRMMSFEASEGGVAGSGGSVSIIIVPPGSSPDYDDPGVFVIEGQPTAVTAPRLNSASPSRDLAVSLAAPEPDDPGVVLILENDGTGTGFDPALVMVGRNPTSIAAADLNGTGDDDLVVTNQNDDSLTIVFNQGGGVYNTNTVAMEKGSRPSAVAAGDLNGNGFIDLAVTNSELNSVSILLNDGVGGFAMQDAIEVGMKPLAVRIEDVDNSKNPDIIVANSESNNVTVILNEGGGVYSTLSPISVGAVPIALSIEDVDNSKHPDIIVVSRLGKSLSIIRNNGDGTFTDAITLPLAGEPNSLDVWDMDGDGDADIAVVLNHEEHGEIVQLIRNDSTGSQLIFTVMPPLAEGESPQLVLGADMTGDALDDLVTLNFADLASGNGAAGGVAGEVPEPGGGSVAIRQNLLGGPKEPPCPADLDGNTVVNVFDLLALLAAWGPCQEPPASCAADLDKNGVVNVFDLLDLLAAWGPCL